MANACLGRSFNLRLPKPQFWYPPLRFGSQHQRPKHLFFLVFWVSIPPTLVFRPGTTFFLVALVPDNAKGGGEKEGGQNLTRRPPAENSFRPPLPRYVLPPPYSISLNKSLRKLQNFPQLTTSETAFGGSRKMVSDGPSSRGFAFRYVLPPPPLVSSAQLSGKLGSQHQLRIKTQHRP